MRRLVLALAVLLMLAGACAQPPSAAELAATPPPASDPYAPARATSQALFERGRAALDREAPREALADLRSARNLDPDRRAEIAELVARVETRVASLPTATPAPLASPVALFLPQPTDAGLARLLARPADLRRILGVPLSAVAEGPLRSRERGRLGSYRLEAATPADRPAAAGGAVRRVLQEVARYGDEEQADASYRARLAASEQGAQPLAGAETLAQPAAAWSEEVEAGSERLSRASVLLRRGLLVVLVAVEQRGGDAGSRALALAGWLDGRLPAGGAAAAEAPPTEPVAPSGQD